MRSSCSVGLAALVLLGGGPWAVAGAAPATLFPHERVCGQRAPASPVPEPVALVFADEFDGDSLDWGVWESNQYPNEIKRATARGPGNLEVADGELRLHVRKESLDNLGRGRSNIWTAGYVYIKEPAPNNVYIESRFKSSASTGVNNAFWLASVTPRRTSWSNRYEIDIVEARREAANPAMGRAHLAWHDWKGHAYITNAAGASDHVAQGISVDHTWEDYHTWGLWYGENEFIYYLDGEEVWRGTTHPRYHDQWNTGVGKFDRWFPDEEDRAYGRHGQDTWRYYGGYTGDRMNIIFSTLPWEASWSPLDDSAHGTWMAVDYVRVFRPVRLLAGDPLQQVDGRELRADAVIPLAHPVELAGGAPAYMALRFTRRPGGSLRLALMGADQAAIGSVTVDGEGGLALELGPGSASTARSWPARHRYTPPDPGAKDLVLMLRLTPDRDGTGAILSACLFAEQAVPASDPYLYHNVDASGNTSYNQHWHLACKAGTAATVAALRVEQADGISLRDFRAGTGFASVAPTAAP